MNATGDTAPPKGGRTTTTMLPRRSPRRLVGTAFLAGGLMLMGFADRDVWLEWQTERWPTTPGVITQSVIVTSTRPYVIGRWTAGRVHARTVHVVYRYAVDGLTYESNRMHVVELETRRVPNEDAARYPQGGKVAVHYDPSNPTQAVLETNVLWSSVVAVVVGVLMAWAGWLLTRRVPPQG